ncbi:hypothetical protein SLEP1_g16903 [Rubroshorea leprosula]|uniref:Uncharacterized protein n=1 Tax=Rubroshorea leprosula TaxID=152421 RepID=A0AAV5IW66_9ROSI|nr:hypothetical protein SLEP1_g16903 [Rubroshorea leprosula]
MRERTQLKKWKVGGNLRTSSRTRFPHPSALSPRPRPAPLHARALHSATPALDPALLLLPKSRILCCTRYPRLLQSRPCCLHASHCCCTAPALLLATVHARRNLHHY